MLSAFPACGGDEFSSGSGGSGGSGGGGSGGSGAAPIGVCPAAQPPAGTACSDEGLYCTFGSDPRPKCRTHVACEQGKVNIVRQPSTGDCPQPLACPIPPPIGQTCSPAGDECAGPDQYCACTCVSAASCTAWTWKCPLPAPTCPSAVPNYGTPCQSLGLSCSYGVCDDDVRDQVVADCVGGVWVWTSQCLP